jgi:hypothetical protein
MEGAIIISFDPEANAIYVKLPISEEEGFGETNVDDLGVIVDTTADGRPRGYEFLNAVGQSPLTSTLPESVASALTDFITSGALKSTTCIEKEY